MREDTFGFWSMTFTKSTENTIILNLIVILIVSTWNPVTGKFLLLLLSHLHPHPHLPSLLLSQVNLLLLHLLCLHLLPLSHHPVHLLLPSLFLLQFPPHSPLLLQFPLPLLPLLFHSISNFVMESRKLIVSLMELTLDWMKSLPTFLVVGMTVRISLSQSKKCLSLLPTMNFLQQTTMDESVHNLSSQTLLVRTEGVSLQVTLAGMNNTSLPTSYTVI
mmetsp:Transcript_1767/g.2411  ORF Transcript_1767/g.2411 Transcript_1767/m.2411 type:complete len:218 (-) Transcript_1767:324-977(-)